MTKKRTKQMIMHPCIKKGKANRKMRLQNGEFNASSKMTQLILCSINVVLMNGLGKSCMTNLSKYSRVLA